MTISELLVLARTSSAGGGGGNLSVNKSEMLIILEFPEFCLCFSHDLDLFQWQCGCMCQDLQSCITTYKYVPGCIDMCQDVPRGKNIPHAMYKYVVGCMNMYQGYEYFLAAFG